MIPAPSFTLRGEYTRAEIRGIVSDPGRGGAWDTGYREYGSEFFIFCGIGAPGRTGHDYNNHWDGEHLIWEAKEGASLEQPQVRKLLSGRYRVHVFTRNDDEAPFRYEGLGRAVIATSTTPVGVTWALDADFRPPHDPGEGQRGVGQARF